MSEVIDLTAARNARTAPNLEFVKQDDFGRPMYQYSLTYEFDGGQWCADLWAYSWEDAEARVAAMRQSIKVDGQLYEAIRF